MFQSLLPVLLKLVHYISELKRTRRDRLLGKNDTISTKIHFQPSENNIVLVHFHG